jgi:hypothetical protein
LPKLVVVLAPIVAVSAVIVLFVLSSSLSSTSILAPTQSSSHSTAPAPSDNSKNLTLYLEEDVPSTSHTYHGSWFIPVSNETLEKYPLLLDAIENATNHAYQDRYGRYVQPPVYYPSISYSEGVAIVKGLHLQSLSLNGEGGTSEIWYNNKTAYYVRIEYPVILTVVYEGKTPSKYRGTYMDEVPDNALDKYPTLAYAIQQLDNYVMSGNNSTGKIHFDSVHAVDEPAYPLIYLPMPVNESNTLPTENNPDLLRFLPTTVGGLYGDHIHYKESYYTVSIKQASGGGMFP